MYVLLKQVSVTIHIMCAFCAIFFLYLHFQISHKLHKNPQFDNTRRFRNVYLNLICHKKK